MWRKGGTYNIAGESLATLSPAVTRKGNEPNVLDLAKEVSKLWVKGVTWLLLVACNKM